MENLEGQEAIPTTENEISPAKVLTGAEAAAYVEGMRRRGEITEWEIPLRSTIHSVTGNYSRTRVDYNEKLGHVFHGLPFYEGESSSNETTEPPAKEKYSAFTPGPWTTVNALTGREDGDGGIYAGKSDTESGGRRLGICWSCDADRALVCAAPDLYDACEKAHTHFLHIMGTYEPTDPVSEVMHRIHGPIVETLAAALTKAGKK